MTNKNGLTYKQQGFIDDYLFSKDPKLLGNGTQCALKWFDCENEDTARSMGSEYLTKPNIKAYIEQKQAEISELIDEKWIVNKLNWLVEKSIDEKQLAVAKGSLELLGKWRAMFTDKQINESEDFADYLKKQGSIEAPKEAKSSDNMTDKAENNIHTQS